LNLFRKAVLMTGCMAMMFWSLAGCTAGRHGTSAKPSSDSRTVVVFQPTTDDLEFLKKGDHSTELAGAALGQAMVAKAQVTFIWSAMVERSKWKYRQRAYRYIYLDAGHIVENLYLAAEALGLGVCAIGALFDDQVNSLIGIDGVEESVIYMASVGLLKNRPGR